MTREEAYSRIDAIIAKYEIDEEYVTITNLKDYDALRMAREILEQEPCDDAISRQHITEQYESCADMLSDEELVGANLVMEWVYKAPSVRPQEQTGHWILTIEDWNKWACSECGYSKRTDIHVKLGYNYCPDCGARMVEPQESEVRNETDN